jgi:hypothetical protein
MIVRDGSADHWQGMLCRENWRVNFLTGFFGRCPSRPLVYELAGRLLWVSVALTLTIAESLDRSFERLERQLLQIAEAMPEDKYSFKPTPDPRTFGEQLRHIAAVQWVVGVSRTARQVAKAPTPLPW